MNTWDRIDHTGFFPRIVSAALRRALAGVEPIASVCQLDAAFDHGSMFRHLTLAAITDSVLVHIHVDELENGGAGVGTAVYPMSKVGAVSTMEVWDEPESGGTLSELTLSVDLGGMSRTEIEPAHCDDPNCQADHGYSAASFPDDLNIRVSAAADGADLLDEAGFFVDHLTRLVSTHV